MKVNQLVLAVLSTFVAGQSMAAAVTAQDFVAAKTPATAAAINEGWLSGASAPALNIYQAFRAGCDADTLAIFTSSSSSTSLAPGALGDYAAYACKRGGTLTAFYHTLNGGSFMAYAPHLPSTVGHPDGGTNTLPVKLERLKAINELATGCATGSATPKMDGVNAIGVPIYYGCAKVKPTASGVADDGAPQIPAGGFSDVEAALWEIDLDALNLAREDLGLDTIGLETNLKVMQGFGVGVTFELYKAMQTAQGLISGSTDLAQAPNITTAQYASIVQSSGGLNNSWSLLANNTTKAVKVFRRTPTSGTQATSNAHFLKNPCSQGKATGFLQAARQQTTELYNVVEYSSSSTLKTDLASANTAGDYAIGVLSLENTPNSSWKFLKLDGVHPEDGDATYATVAFAKGSYPLAMEMRAFEPTTQAGTYGATLLTELKSALSNPDCSTFAQLRGLTLASTYTGTSCTVAAGRKSRVTHGGKNCSPLQVTNATN